MNALYVTECFLDVRFSFSFSQIWRDSDGLCCGAYYIIKRPAQVISASFDFYFYSTWLPNQLQLLLAKTIYSIRTTLKRSPGRVIVGKQWRITGKTERHGRQVTVVRHSRLNKDGGKGTLVLILVQPCSGSIVSSSDRKSLLSIEPPCSDKISDHLCITSAFRQLDVFDHGYHLPTGTLSLLPL